MNFYRGYLLRTAGWCFSALLVVALFVQLRAWRGGPSLRVEWDGFGGRLNYRDLGVSLNECLEAVGDPPLLKEGYLGRSNHKFSGFSCGRVGYPDVIYSLSYQPTRQREYFCFDDAGVKVGKHFNTTVILNDLEYTKTWENPTVRADACGFFRDSFLAIAAGKKTLVHCEAGRDRTGTYAALLQALIAELNGRLDDNMLAAIECDYRRTRSLKEYKFGRMEAFLRELRLTGGVNAFFGRFCGIEPELTQKVADAMMWEGRQ